MKRIIKGMCLMLIVTIAQRAYKNFVENLKNNNNVFVKYF